MFVRTKESPNSPGRKSIQIVVSKREGKKVRQKILRHVGVAENEDELKKLYDLAEHIKANMLIEARGGASLFPAEELAKQAIEHRDWKKNQEKLPIDDLRAGKEIRRVISGFHDVYGSLYDEIGYHQILKSKKNIAVNKILREVVLARIAKPKSKRESSRYLLNTFDVSIPLQKIYRMMDRLDDNTIKEMKDLTYRNTRSMISNNIKVMFFDCTTLYFESTQENDLKKPGYSKDGKHQQDQVVLALMVTDSGLPVGYEVFSGNTWEGKSFEPMLEEVHKQFPDSKAVFVADSGMFSQHNLSELEKLGKHYIIGARIRCVPKDLKAKITDLSAYQELNHNKGLKAKIFDHKGRKLVVTWCYERAQTDAKKRRKKVEKLKEKLKASDDPSKLLERHTLKSFFTIEGDSKVKINEVKIAESAKWDGLKGIITNTEDLSISNILERYRELWQVEYSFRVTKHDLKARPIFHYTPRRIKAHLAISFMAYTCVRYLEYRLKTQKKVNLSPNEIKLALECRQHTVFEDQSTGNVYGIPSTYTQNTKVLYSVMGQKLSQTPFLISKKES